MASDYKLLGIAIQIATEAHAGQFDKGGKPYILHPLHLMTQMLFDTELAIMAVLHDVVEDSEVTLKDLETYGFSDRVIEALDTLTHNPLDTYEQYIARISYNYDAIRVKRKDLQHNSDITRLKGLREKDFKRLEKYSKAFVRLGAAKKLFEKV